MLMVLCVFACDARNVTSERAQKIASERFLKVCANFKLAPQSYDGPYKTDVGGVDFAFEWYLKPGQPGDVILITVDSGGSTNVSFAPGDKPAQSNTSKGRPEPTK